MPSLLPFGVRGERINLVIDTQVCEQVCEQVLDSADWRLHVDAEAQASLR